jgi:hypothetical protein
VAVRDPEVVAERFAYYLKRNPLAMAGTSA